MYVQETLQELGGIYPAQSYGIILIVIGIILAALHFIVAGDGIRDFISSIIAVISVLVILVGTYITFSEIRNCK